MARSIILTLAWGTVAMLQVAQASLLLAPRTLRPQSLRPQMLLGASSSSPSCNNIDKSCADCYNVLSCSNLNGVFVPISTTTCPTSAPYCLDGACVTSLSSTDTCYKKPSVDFTCIGDGYFPSPSNCKKYYLCVDSLPYEYDCSSYSNTVYSHEKAMCVPSSEATCSVVSCTTALLGKYQPWAQDKSVYFVCTDTNATHAYVSDCGSDHQINTTTGYCELACLREGRLPAEDPKSYYECVQTAAQTFVGPTLATCPGNSTYSATTQRCVHGSASDSDEENEYPREDLFEPNDSVPESLYNIPANMLIGSASAAYQIEGAWNTSRKSPSIWDVFFHSRPTAANGDVACDSYHRWQEDIEMLKTLKMQSYRLSLSWTRLLPGGSQADGYDSDGVDYYNNVINGLIDAGITPIITLYHWDLPQIYQDDGGWLNPAVVDRFADFADFAFSTFGDRIKIWVILNEPNQYCPNGYETNKFAPGVTQIGTGGYLCMHHSILAHAKAWHVYDDKYRASQQGRVGSSPSFPWNEPDGESEEAQEAAERGNEFSYGWFMDALFTGDYPVSMRTNVDANSAAEGLSTSRLPTFTAEQKASIIGAIDFVGMNHYASSLTSSGTAKQTDSASIAKDTNTTTRLRDTWVPQPYGGVTPWGLRYALNWLKDRYGKSILVTENGYPGVEGEGTTDPARVGYHSTYMRAVMRAVNEDRCDVFGYTAWSLEDNLEWTVGYRLKFGLVYVDFNDPDRPRTPKDSASFFQKLAETRYVPYVQPTVPL